MFPQEAEVVIIGGGVVGSAAAYFLAKENRNVVLVERGYVAGEATGGNAAWVWSLSRKAGIDIELATHSVSIYKQLQKELELDFEYTVNGGLMVIDGENQFPYVQAHLDARKEAGFPLKMIDAKETLEIQPLLNKERILGGVWNPADGTTNPIMLVAALNHEARKLGAQIYHRTEVKDIEVRDGQVKSVTCGQGTIKTNCVINAAGSWAGQIGKMVGINVPISPFQMAILVTESVPHPVPHPIMGASYMVEEDAGKSGELGVGLIASQQRAGNLLLGASWRDAGFDKRTIQEEIECMAKVNVEAMPALRDVRVIRSFANFFPHSADDLPILGFVQGVEGFVMASGHNGHGVCLGPGSGKLVAELICTGTTSVGIEELRLERPALQTGEH
ncbi:MAG: hypothetical protein CSA26_01580 [Desulfobacterales bacterium]|nr:MAG: hypothetical protein CSA26_01580 [Desulfobacterales bacterium]